MTCVAGKLIENRYHDKKQALGYFERTITKNLRPLDVSHINNTHGLHEVVNVNDGYSISLHLYIPCMHTYVFYDIENTVISEVDGCALDAGAQHG